METKIEDSNQIVDNKLAYKKKLNYLRNNFVAYIYKGLIENLSYKDFSKKVLEMPNQVGIPNKYFQMITYGTINLYHKLSKINYFIDFNGEVFANKHNVLSDTTLALGLTALHSIEKERVMKDRITATANNVFEKLEGEKAIDILDKIISNGLSEYENDSKTKYIDSLKNEAKSFERVFYLCSWHADSAPDHAPYQGKYYISKDWKAIIQDKELKEKIQQYIDTNNIKTFESIIDKPVWLTTRPHCRHFFRLIDTNTVISGKAIEIVLRNYKMKREVGEKGDRLQTIVHSTAGYWYREENVREIIERYMERLDMHEKMYKEFKSPYLFAAIKKDKILIAKWQAYLQVNFL